MANTTETVVVVRAVNETDRAFNAVNQNMRRTSKTASHMNQQFRFMRGGLGQVGHQVQDIAVQLQMGQNAMLIFGQQGSQIASLFGPHGAILGAFLAVGAALGTAFMPGVFGATKALDKLAEAQDAVNKIMANTSIGEATAEYQELLDVSAALAGMQMDVALNKLAIGIESNKEALISALGGSVGVSSDLLAMQENIAQGNDQFAKQQREFMAEVNKQSELDLISQFGTSGVELKEVIEDLFGAKTSDQVKASIEQLMGIQGTTEAFSDAKLAAAEYALGLFKLKREEEKLNTPLEVAGFEKKKKKSDKLDKDSLEAVANQMAAEESIVMQGYETAVKNARKATVTEAARVKAARDARINEMAAEEALVGAGIQTAIDNREAAAEETLAARKAALEDEYRLEQEYIESGEAGRIAADHKAVLAARDLAEEQIRIKKDAAEKQAQIELQAISTAESAMAMMGSALKDGTDAQKAAFAIEKALAITSIIINTHAAASKAAAVAAIGGPQAWFATEAAITAIGYAKAGVVAGTTLASFEGGGFTGNGIRAGGMDGKGGKIAMVHPNEKIIDMEQGGDTQAVNVTFNIQANDTKGFDQLLASRRGTIVGLINQAMNNRGKAGVV